MLPEAVCGMLNMGKLVCLVLGGWRLLCRKVCKPDRSLSGVAFCFSALVAALSVLIRLWRDL